MGHNPSYTYQRLQKRIWSKNNDLNTSFSRLNSREFGYIVIFTSKIVVFLVKPIINS